jgi:hypothetical protein
MLCIRDCTATIVLLCISRRIANIYTRADRAIYASADRTGGGAGLENEADGAEAPRDARQVEI